MPNVIVQLQQEIYRVSMLVPKLDPRKQQAAQQAIETGKRALERADYGDILSALDDLLEFGKKPTAPEAA